jgi:hypothetical protein
MILYSHIPRKTKPFFFIPNFEFNNIGLSFWAQAAQA